MFRSPSFWDIMHESVMNGVSAIGQTCGGTGFLLIERCSISANYGICREKGYVFGNYGHGLLEKNI